MRRSVTAASRESGMLDAIAGSSETAENIANAGNKTDSAKNEKENGLGVEPAVEKIAEKAADNDGRDEYEGQLHGDSSLVGNVFCFLLCG